MTRGAADEFAGYSLRKRRPSPAPLEGAYAARPPGGGRPVEVRVLRRPVDPGSGPAHRFDRFMTRLRELSHPRAVKVRDHGAVGETLYYVTDLRDGTSLRAWAADRRDELTALSALDLMLPVGEALVAMHRAGLAHRDLSPDTIRVEAVTEQAYLASFGIFKELRLPRMTESGFQLAFSTAAQSPELARGQPEDQRTDAYLFATVLHHLVTGEHLATSLEVARGWAPDEARLPPPSELLGEACAPLDGPLARALDHDPAARHDQLDDLLTELAEARLALSQMVRPVKAGRRRGPGRPPAGAAGEPPSGEADARPRRPARGARSSRGLRGVDPAPGPDPVRTRMAAAAVGAVVLVAGILASASGPGVAPAPTRVRYRKARRASPDQKVQAAAEARQRLQEVAARPTTPKSFEARLGALRALRAGLGADQAEVLVPRAALGQLRLMFFRDPEAACAQLDRLVASVLAAAPTSP